MKRATCILSLFILLFCSVPFLSVAQTVEIGEWVNGLNDRPCTLVFSLYSKRDATVFQEKWKLIEDENAGSKNDEWAGDYSEGVTGDTHMIMLRWSQNSGFVFASLNNCAPTLMGLNYGKAVLSPGWLELFPEASDQPAHPDNPNAASIRKLPAKRFVPVKWGELHYLIPESKVGQFYDYVAGLGIYQTFDWGGGGEPGFLLKIEDQDKTPKGMPVLPPGHERLVKHPIEANITAVENRVIKKRRADNGEIYYDLATPVTIDRGRAEGVKSGMRFRVVGSKEREELKITYVGIHSSRAVIKRSLDDRSQSIFKDWETGITRLYPEIMAGWRVTTSFLLSEQY